jgi:hypothetical protein
MAVVKTHIILDEDKADVAEERTSVLAKIREKAAVSAINEKRLKLYGVITCDIDDSLLDEVRKIPGVRKVEIDQERELSKPVAQKSARRGSR